ncbi:MAG: sensor histidine kinase, partial [Planctomycetota bacterium]
ATVEKSPEKLLAPATHTKIKGIEEHVQHLTTLVERLLDVSRIAENRLVLQPQDADFVAIVKEVVERLGAAIDASGCEVTVRSPASLVGCWDRVRLGQVFTNLLSNAVKYGAGKPVEVGLEAIDGSARLSVKDHGIGIELGKMERIFTRFHRGVPATSYGGFGLGLWISKELVAAMSGEIRVDSQPGQGARFTVTVPTRFSERARIPASERGSS